MKRFIERVSVTFLVFLFPLLTFGQQQGGGPGIDDEDAGGGPGIAPARGSAILENPLNVGSIEALLSLILDIIVIFATPVIVFFVIYSGFLFVTAQGNPERLKDAKRAFLWTIIGGLIVLGASAILAIIVATISSIQA